MAKRILAFSLDNPQNFTANRLTFPRRQMLDPLFTAEHNAQKSTAGGAGITEAQWVENALKLYSIFHSCFTSLFSLVTALSRQHQEVLIMSNASLDRTIWSN